MVWEARSLSFFHILNIIKFTDSGVWFGSFSDLTGVSRTITQNFLSFSVIALHAHLHDNLFSAPSTLICL